MGICWFCHWGWPKPIADIYIRALHDLGGDDRPLHFGPAHVVWEDENFDSAEWCLENFEEYAGGFSEKDLVVVRRSLEELTRLPLSIRREPEGYDDEHPEMFPPPEGLAMVKM